MGKGLLIAFAFLLLAHGASWLASGQRPVLRVETAEGAEHLYADLDPGEFAGTLMLGGLRGLAIDILWMRATGAKDAGRFYESVALFQMIAKTQPQFETVWEYMAWDMAYNIANEVEGREAQFAWFVSGVEAAVEGSLRNPRGERIMRYLAWMMVHRGNNFVAEVEARDWGPLLDPLLSQENIPVPPKGSSPQAVGAAVYRFVLAMGERRDVHVPAFVRRILPINLEYNGNLARNRGQHREAVFRYLEALESWQDAAEWARQERQRIAEDPSLDERRRSMQQDQSMVTLSTYERIEGQLRRKTADLIRRLASDPEQGEATAQQLMQRDFAAVVQSLAANGWHDSVPGAPGIVWYDEQ